MQALATRCCESAELMERRHYQGSCDIPAIDKRPTAASRRYSCGFQFQRALSAPVLELKNHAGCPSRFATCATFER